MRLIKLLSLGLLLLAVSFSTSAKETYLGTFLYSYDSGSVYRMTVNDATSMHWECIKGDEKGAAGEEKPERFKINARTFFVTWTEKTGIQVSQALDLKSMKVYSTIIDGKNRYVVQGKVTREK